VLDVEIPSVKEMGAMIITGLDSLEVEALPKDLIDQIAVDPSVLEVIGDSISVSDITPPPGVTVLDDPEMMVVMATAPSMIEEEEEIVDEELLEGEEAIGEPEVIEKGKEEEEDDEA